MKRSGNGRRRLFALLTAAGIWAVAEAVSWIALAAVGESSADATSVASLSERHREILTSVLEGRESHIEIDPSLGWTTAPGSVNGDYRINGSGLRSDLERSPEERRGALRIATFGDSFTFGAGVNGLLTFQETLMRLRPELEVLNFGVPGYGLDQAYLRYLQEGPTWAPDVVLIGYMTENVNRVVNTFRPFYRPQTGLPFAKPRFLLADEGLELVPNPLPGPDAYRTLLARPGSVLPRLARHDAYAPEHERPALFARLPSMRLIKRSLRSDEEDASAPAGAAAGGREADSYEVTRRLFDRFYRDVEASGARAVIVLFPRQQDIGLRRRGEPTMLEPLLEQFEARGYLRADLLALLEAATESPKELANPHLTPRAHTYAAVELLQLFEREGLIEGGDDSPATVRAELIRALERSPSFAELDAGSRRTVLAQAERGLAAAI